MRRSGLLLWALLHIGAQADNDISVVVSHSVFDKRMRGHNFSSWSDFVEAAGEQNNPGGEARLKAGMALLLAAIASITVGAMIFYAANMQMGKPYTAWLVLAILLLYAAAVFTYCMAAYQNPAQRLITNLLFGLVPWTISCASYLLAFLIWERLELSNCSLLSEGVGNSSVEPERGQLFSVALPSSEQQLTDADMRLRLFMFLAVLPSMAISVYLTCTVATGFTGVGTLFDVLALCLFVDVWRLVTHAAFLVAPQWALAITRPNQRTRPSEQSSSSVWAKTMIPGIVELTLVMCLCWYCVLGWIQTHPFGSSHADPIKLHVLACLTSYVFFPLAVVKISYINYAVFSETNWTWFLMIWTLAAFMLLVAMFFNATEPNTIGICCMVSSVVYAAVTFSSDLPGCICMLLASTCVTIAFVFCSVHYAEDLRTFVGQA